MFLDRAAKACYLLSAFLFLAAAYGYFTQEDGPGASIDEPERMVTHLTAGQTTAITFNFHNPTRHPVRVCGLPDC
jgi:hypothetical protein